jgi:hypothetical protein
MSRNIRRIRRNPNVNVPTTFNVEAEGNLIRRIPRTNQPLAQRVTNLENKLTSTNNIVAHQAQELRHYAERICKLEEQIYNYFPNDRASCFVPPCYGEFNPCLGPKPCCEVNPCLGPKPCCEVNPCLGPKPCCEVNPCLGPKPCCGPNPCCRPNPCCEVKPCCVPNPCCEVKPCCVPNPCFVENPCEEKIEESICYCNECMPIRRSPCCPEIPCQELSSSESSCDRPESPCEQQLSTSTPSLVKERITIKKKYKNIESYGSPENIRYQMPFANNYHIPANIETEYSGHRF